MILDLADEGEVVIVSHAASHALAGAPDVLRVLVTASPEIRARRIEGVDPLGFAEAKRKVAASDDARADYLRWFYGVEAELPTQYDQQAASVIVGAARL